MTPNRAAGAGLEYRLLGTIEVRAGGVPLELGPPKQRAVLAVLLLAAGRTVSDRRIVSAVWGADPPGSVASSLQAYVSNLRRLLRGPGGASPIRRSGAGYALDVRDAVVDVAEFVAAADEADAAVAGQEWPRVVVAAERALTLWRGDVLADLGVAPWIRGEAAPLEERRAACADQLVVGLLGAGDLSRAVAESVRCCAAHPLRERAHELSAVALHRQGRTVDALAVLRAFRRRLADEAGLEPGPAVRELETALLRQEPTTAWPGDGAASRGTPSASGSGALRDHGTPFVGRSREIGLTGEVIGVPGAPGVRWLVYAGPPGIGKSRLADVVAERWSAAGGRVVATRCPEDDGTPPWWPIRRLLAQLGVDPAEVLSTRPGDDVDGARFAVYERVSDALTAVPEPTLLVVDDVQWADAASLRLLAHLADALRGDGLAVVLTVRTGVGGDDLRRLLAAVARCPRGRHVDVAPLTPVEVGVLASEIAGEDVGADEAARIADRTGGNPFFVTEYARLPRAERDAGGVPAAVSAVLGRRLAALDTVTLSVLRTAAVLGEEIDTGLLIAVTGLPADDVADHLDEAADEHVIGTRANGRGCAFVHALVRDEILAGISDLRRRRLHARVAAAIGENAAGDDIARRAGHLRAALPLVDEETVVDACRAAALRAEAEVNSEAAADWWEAALEALDRVPGADVGRRDALVEARLAALARAGRWQLVLDAVGEGLVDGIRRGRVDSVGRLAATLLRTAGAWPWVSTDADPEVLRTRLAGVEPRCLDVPAAHARVLAAMAVGAYYDPDESVRDEFSRRAVAIAESCGDVEVLADVLLGRALTLAGVAAGARESLAVLDRFAMLDRRMPPLDGVMRDNLLSNVCFTLGDVEASQRHQRAGVTGADALRLPVYRVQLRWVDAAAAQWRGTLPEARRRYREANDVHRKTEMYLMGVHTNAKIAVRWAEGRLDLVDDIDDLTPSLRLLGRTVLAAGRGDAAAADALVAEQLDDLGPRIWTSHAQLTLLGHIAADLGLRRHADRLYEELEPYSGLIANIGQVGEFGPIDLVLARLAALRGDVPDARRLLRRAVDLAERTGGRTAALWCRWVAATLSAADVSPEAADAEFAAIIGVAEVLGATGIAAAARNAAGGSDEVGAGVARSDQAQANRSTT